MSSWRLLSFFKTTILNYWSESSHITTLLESVTGSLLCPLGFWNYSIMVSSLLLFLGDVHLSLCIKELFISQSDSFWFLLNIFAYSFLPFVHCLLFSSRWCIMPKLFFSLVNNWSTTIPEWRRLQRGCYPVSVGRLARGSCQGNLFDRPLTAWCCRMTTLIWHFLWLSESTVSRSEDNSPTFSLCLSLSSGIFLSSSTCDASSGFKQG